MLVGPRIEITSVARVVLKLPPTGKSRLQVESACDKLQRLSFYSYIALVARTVPPFRSVADGSCIGHHAVGTSENGSCLVDLRVSITFQRPCGIIEPMESSYAGVYKETVPGSPSGHGSEKAVSMLQLGSYMVVIRGLRSRNYELLYRNY